MGILKFLAAVLIAAQATVPVAPPLETIRVTATAYTCDAHPRNPMHPCGPLRWGGEVEAPGMACPAAWRDRRFYVPRFGVLRCDDTPRDETLHGYPHVDLRVSTYERAMWWGVRPLVIVACPELCVDASRKCVCDAPQGP